MDRGAVRFLHFTKNVLLQPIPEIFYFSQLFVEEKKVLPSSQSTFGKKISVKMAKNRGCIWCPKSAPERG